VLAALVALVVVAAGAVAIVATRDDESDAVGSGVPSVIGLAEDEAQAAVVDGGYSTQIVRRSDAKPAGTVVAQQPPAGRAAAPGSVVVLVVSTGAEGGETVPETSAGEQVSVPDVTATHQILAGATLDGRGLVADSVPVANDAECGTVVGQEPEAGARVQAGAHVRLLVALGREARPLARVPGLSGAAAAARASAREFGFTVRTVERPAAGPQDVGVVLRQVPAALTRVRELTQITLVVGR
jgi:serine/threonine-protein kinase